VIIMTQTTGYPPPTGWYPAPPPPPAPPRRWLPWAIVLGALALVAVLLAVVLATRGGDGPEPPPLPPTDGPVEPSGGITTDYLLSLIGAPASSEEIGALDQQCGSNVDQLGNLECPAYGFEITFDPSMTATRVVLYPYQENSMAEYAGELPGGITWDYTYADLVAEFGEAQLEGGWGAIDYTAHYYGDGWDYAFGLSTWYSSELPTAHITSITISPH
jgi:hypothetical protein